jgi:uncharacterized membrane protein YgaE (UPF0421/DUF939 family)
VRVGRYFRASSRAPLAQVVKTSIAVALAWVSSGALLDQPLPIFAAIAALLVVQPSINQSIARGIERSVGVILGVVVASLAAAIFGTNSWIVLGVIAVCLLLGWLLRLGPASATQIPISAMLLLSLGANTPGYAFERVLETVMGAAVAMIVNVAIAPPVLLVPAHVAVQRLLEECASTLDHLAASLRDPQTAQSLEALLVHARSLRSLEAAADTAIATGEESLTLNPQRRAHRQILDRDMELLSLGTVLARRIIGMARALRDHYDSSLHVDPTVIGIAREASRAAHDLRLLAHDLDAAQRTRNARGSEADLPEEPPALTAPLMIPRPHPQHWVLIGSLIEDMRRVREEIIAEDDDD